MGIEYLTVEAAAARTGVSAATIWRRIRDKQLPVQRLYGRAVIAAADLAAAKLQPGGGRRGHVGPQAHPDVTVLPTLAAVADDDDDSPLAEMVEQLAHIAVSIDEIGDMIVGASAVAERQVVALERIATALEAQKQVDDV